MERVCSNCLHNKPEGCLLKKSPNSFGGCPFHRFSASVVQVCRNCGKEDVYGDMTDGLCLNCYQQLQDDIREMEIEYRLDNE